MKKFEPKYRLKRSGFEVKGRAGRHGKKDLIGSPRPPEARVNANQASLQGNQEPHEEGSWKGGDQGRCCRRQKMITEHTNTLQEFPAKKDVTGAGAVVVTVLLLCFCCKRREKKKQFGYMQM
eukprot:TRINITY_DN2585_c0_g1_i2.p2 TRINITY_DN2585_c0_g1~~TRINITY_DN2585_c0_g1_i2.p2  ORF type:complete len:122 (+),score=20.78 TRINITY_DN2585_c0_g1_i2:91-456(+)